MDKQKILDTHKFRFACKEFDISKKINKDDFEFILEVARLSPSSVGLEPWNFIVVQNNEFREKLIPYCSGGIKQLKTASHFIIITVRTMNDLKYNSDYVNYIFNDIKKSSIEELQKIKSYLKFFQDKFDKKDLEKEIFNWSVNQGYIVLANMMTAAAQIKIDSCAIGGFDKLKVEQVLENEGILNKNQFGICCMLALGYRKEPHENIKLRQPLDKIVKFI